MDIAGEARKVGPYKSRNAEEDCRGGRGNIADKAMKVGVHKIRSPQVHCRGKGAVGMLQARL